MIEVRCLKKHGSRRKDTETNSKGNVGKNLFVFSDSGRNFHSFLTKKINFHPLDLEHASPNKNI